MLLTKHSMHLEFDSDSACDVYMLILIFLSGSVVNCGSRKIAVCSYSGSLEWYSTAVTTI